MYKPNNIAAKYVRQKVIKEKRNKSAIIVGDFNTPSTIDKTTRQIINKDINDIKNTTN